MFTWMGYFFTCRTRNMCWKLCKNQNISGIGFFSGKAYSNEDEVLKSHRLSVMETKVQTYLIVLAERV